MKYCPNCANTLQDKKIENKSRKVCTQCDFIHWNNPTPVVGAIVELGGKIVLAHNKLWPPKMMALITGFLDEKEAPEQAIVREVKEELSLNSTEVTLIGAYGFEQQNQVIIVYHVVCEGEIELGDELDEYKLIEPEKLKPWKYGTGPAVHDWLVSKGLMCASADES